MPNKRISDLTETLPLTSNQLGYPFRSSALVTSDADEDALFLLARSGSHNEKIKYKDLKFSLTDNVAYLTGKQLISGEKTFVDECTFLSTTRINEIIDITHQGDISGNIFVGETGLFEQIGVGDKYFLRESDITKTLEIDGDSFFHGSVEITGDAYRNGKEHHLDGNSEYIGDISFIGDQFQKGDFDLLGDSKRLGNITQTGNGFFHSELKVYGDIRLGEYMFSHHDRAHEQFFEKVDEESITTFFPDNVIGQPHTFLRFEPDSIELKASNSKESSIRWFEDLESGLMLMSGAAYNPNNAHELWERQGGSGIAPLVSGVTSETGKAASIIMDNDLEKSIRFYVAENEEAISITKSGSFGVNAEDPFAQLSMSGDAYITHVDTHAYGEWGHVYPGPEDETICYNTALREGKDSYLINFPKTFDGAPVLSVSVKHEKGGVIIPFMISGLTESQFNINFTSPLPDNNYKVNTIAMSTGDPDCYERAMFLDKIQRFTKPISAGSFSYRINFPINFESTPIVSTTVEGEEKFLPHLISGITTEGYNITFGTRLKNDYKIHTTSSLAGTYSRCEPNHEH